MGLTTSEVEELKKRYGTNEIQDHSSRSWMKILLEILVQPMFLLLIGCGILYIIIGDYKEGIVLFSANILIIGISFHQQFRSEASISALKKLGAPFANAIRNGETYRLPAKELVPGDVVLLEAGDLIPADGFLLKGTLSANEAILTGESVPVVKTNEQSKNELSAGTLVSDGSGTMRVNRIGLQCAIGKISQSLKSIKSSETPLQIETRKVILKSGIVGLGICLLVTIILYLKIKHPTQAILNGITAAMAILPEEFPVVFSVFLAMGSWKLSKRNILVRKAVAIETLGATSVLCCDKTGTITHGQLELKRLIPFLESHENTLDFPSLCKMAATPNGKDGIDQAILAFFKETSFNLERYLFLHSKAFSHEDLTSICTYQDKKYSTLLSVSKGAPEKIIDECDLSDIQREKCLTRLKKEAELGRRVLGISYREVTTIHENSEQFNKEKLHFAGFLSFHDPVRQDASVSIQDCMQAGIKVVLMTGDFPETASAVAKEIGLPTKKRLVGSEIDQMSQEELQQALHDCNVIARVLPEHKLRIIDSLRKQGETVAMTGDGVNDAPALKAANIGIAMGKRGTDVAREASAIVVLNDSFASIVEGIKVGRHIFDNLQKAFVYILTVHIPIISLTILPLFLNNTPILLLPLHVIFLELIIDPVSSIAFEKEEAEHNIMSRPPRELKKGLFGKNELKKAVIHGTLLFLSVIGVFAACYLLEMDDKSTRTCLYSTLIVNNLILVFFLISNTRSLWQTVVNKNWHLKIMAFAAIVLLISIWVIPGLRDLFSFAPLSAQMGTLIAGGSFLYFIAVYLLKKSKFID
jgi:Ca2+-transporting ATPase